MTLPFQPPHDGPCPQPDPALVRKFEKKLRQHWWNANGGFMALMGWLAVVTWALTKRGLTWWEAVPLIAWSTHCFGAHLLLFFGSLRLLRDRNFWRKFALHDLDQLTTKVIRDISEGEEWKRP